jgi:Nucleotidyl transferase AbiEii toxin, Type IV TA system
VKIAEHPEFEQAILAASEHFRERGLRAAVIEKDYYVTEALRAIATGFGDRVVFKGGTSLSKGWNLIQRFSEDIDLFLNPLAFKPPLGTNAIDKQLKVLRDTVANQVPMSFMPGESLTFGGFGRNDRFGYMQRFAGPGEVVGSVLLEAGIASGEEPTEVVPLQSYLAEFLRTTGVSLGTENESAFPMRLLHFRRTFVEKLFAIHKKVEFYKRDGDDIGPHARHYYDLFQLAGRNEVIAMLQSDEYGRIKQDYERVSQKHFPKHYFAPVGMSFATSEAIFPPQQLSAMLAQEYNQQCELLCFGPYAAWQDVLNRFETLRAWL